MPTYIANVRITTCRKGLPSGHPEREPYDIQPGQVVSAEVAERQDENGRMWLIEQGYVSVKSDPPAVPPVQDQASDPVAPVQAAPEPVQAPTASEGPSAPAPSPEAPPAPAGTKE